MADHRPPKLLTRLYSVILLLGLVLGWLFPQFGQAFPTFRIHLGVFTLAVTPVFDFLFLVLFFSLLPIDLQKVRDYLVRPRYWLPNLAFLGVSFGLLPWIWFQAGKFFHLEPELLFGLVFTIIAPTILLAPIFTELLNGDKEFAFLLSAFATLISPLLIPLVAGWLLERSYHFNQLEVLIKGLILIVIPLLLKIALDSAGLNPLEGQRPAAQRWRETVRGINIVLLALLFCSIMGDNKANILNAGKADLWFLSLMAFLQDFGLYWISWAFLSRLKIDLGKAKALAVSLSLKNITLTIGMIQSISSRAVLPGAVTFVAHSALFALITLLGADSLSPRAAFYRLKQKFIKEAV